MLKRIPLKDKYEMRRLRIEERLSYQKIADKVGYSKSTARYYGGHSLSFWDPREIAKQDLEGAIKECAELVEDMDWGEIIEGVDYPFSSSSLENPFSSPSSGKDMDWDRD